MGFYLEMRRSGTRREYGEHEIPPAYWFLFAVAGFALSCMGAAALTVMRDLVAMGNLFDKALIALILSSVPLFLFLGLKLLGIRRYVAFDGNTFELGHRFFGRPLWVKRIARDQIEEIEIRNDRPSPNLALLHQDDPGYVVRGHWKVLVKPKTDKPLVADRHVERAAIEPLYQDLLNWLGGGV